MSARDGVFRRSPRQERSRTTVDAIFEAASRLLDDAGVEGATTARIAHVAGVSIGSLYQYFPKKEALFGALTQRAIAEDLARVREAVDRARDLPLEPGAREVLRAGFAFALERPRLFCWMLRYLPQLGLSHAAEEMERALIVETTRFLVDHRAEIGDGDPSLLAAAGVGAVRGALLTLARERPSFFLESGDRILDLATDLTIGGLVQNRYRAAGWRSNLNATPENR
ncbi:MAG: TetR/AcrR family transcriptional regulator [Polyangiaceae bacterium]